MIIRKAISKDVPGIAKVHVDTWHTTYRGIIPDKHLANLSYKKKEHSWNQIIDRASETNNFTFVAEDKFKNIIGFANGGLERDNNSVYKGELNAIYIYKNYQRKGIGRALFLAAVEQLYFWNIHSLIVWVLADNSACQFYEKLGGERAGEKQIERGGKQLIELAYGWSNLTIQASGRSRNENQ